MSGTGSGADFVMDVHPWIVVRLCDAVEQLLPHLAGFEIEGVHSGADVLLVAAARWVLAVTSAGRRR